MVEVIGRIILAGLEIFMKDAQERQRIARKVMVGLSKWDREALQSAELRDMFQRIEEKARADGN